MDQTDSYPVKLYVYDLSKGMARQLSASMLGEFLTNSVMTQWDASEVKVVVF